MLLLPAKSGIAYHAFSVSHITLQALIRQQNVRRTARILSLQLAAVKRLLKGYSLSELQLCMGK